VPEAFIGVFHWQSQTHADESPRFFGLKLSAEKLVA